MSAYYTESRKYYTEPPTIHQSSRGSSSDSHSSYDSRRSTEPNYPSSKSTMGYSGGSYGKVDRPVDYHKYRVPDAGNYMLITRTCRVFANEYRSPDKKYVESTRRGNVEVIHQNRRGYDPVEPRASDASSSDYRVKRDEHRHSTKHSSHKHSSRR